MPNDCLKSKTNSAAGFESYSRWYRLSESPKPGRSGAITRYPASARASILQYQLRSESARPWSSNTKGPSPAST